MKWISWRGLRIISMIRFSARATPAFAGIQVAVSTDGFMAGIDRGTYQSRRVEREVALQSLDIMKLGIEIARTARVRTWCQRRNNLEVLARRSAVRLARRIGHTHAHALTRTHTKTQAQANFVCEYIFARTSSAFEARSYCALSGGKCVRLTRSSISRTLRTRAPIPQKLRIDFNSGREFARVCRPCIERQGTQVWSLDT